MMYLVQRRKILHRWTRCESAKIGMPPHFGVYQPGMAGSAKFVSTKAERHAVAPALEAQVQSIPTGR